MPDLVYHKKCLKCKREFTSNYYNSNACHKCQGEVVILKQEGRRSFLSNLVSVVDKPQVSIAYKSIVYTEGHIGNSTLKEFEDVVISMKFKLKMYKRFAKEQGWKDVGV